MDTSQLDRLSTLFKALSDPARLRILGLLAERQHAGHELAERLGLTPPTISHHMRRLVDAGIVDFVPQAQSRVYSLRAHAFRDLTQAVVPERPTEPAIQEEDAVLRAFFDGERLRQIPSSRKKRVVVLRRLLERFAPDRDYTEREINDLLRPVHEDVATLRRELVDYGFLTRDRGVYRLATQLPGRGATVRQEVGNETQWFQELVAAATARAIAGPRPLRSETPGAPRE